MDSSVASDPRFKILAKKLGVDWKLAVGACWLVWLACYERREGKLSPDEVDVAAEIDGFCEALLAVKLATRDRGGRVVIHGVQARIRFLLEQASRGSQGGRSSAKTRKYRDMRANAVGLASANTTSPAPDEDRDEDLSPSGAKLADELREAILRMRPGHQLRDPKLWLRTRPRWATELGELAKRVGTSRPARAIAWVFGDQDGREPRYRIVVESPAALAEKLDKIELAMDRSKPAPPRQPTLADLRVDEDWGRSESTNIRRG